MSPPGGGERPKWSITWLLRIQRVGRERAPAGEPGRGTGFQWFSWVVTALLVVVIVVLVWLGLLPR